MGNAAGQYTIQECIYNSENSLLCRAVDERTGESVILKTSNEEAMSPKGLARLRNEYNILSKLKSEFVAEAIDLVKLDETFFLVLKYYSGISLAEYIQGRSLGTKEFLFLGRAITRALADIHRAGVIHKDLNPANIIYSPQMRKVTIIDFGISVESSFERPLLIDPGDAQGTLSYISPEQTGRMNRSIDFRTDFYSLGVTFFEMLCGERPFAAQSQAEMLYDLVARTPPEARAVNPQVPQMLSALVSKLMEKMPEDRYRSAEGILFDLDKCLAAFEALGEILPFDLGLGDHATRLDIPHKLYGRETEIAALEEAFRGVSQGGKCAVFIGGQPGIGKTSLAGELHKLIAASNGIMISGQYDQYQRNIPHHALFQLFRSLCDILLAESEDNVALWKERIAAALGEDAALLVDKVPRLALIVGQPQPLPELTPIEAGIRFRAAVQRLLAVVASPKRPLVLFMDDMHLVSAVAMDILEQSIMSNDIDGLLVVCCYRDGDVDDSHPMLLSLNKLRSLGAPVQQIILSRLSQAAVRQMLADTFGADPEIIGDLAQVLYRKTNGNPFYTRQFLMLCHMKGFIRFSKPHGRWEWDLEAVSACPAEENVVDFLIHNMDQLPAETARLLSLGACAGHCFSIDLLVRLTGGDGEQVAAGLRPAIAGEVIYPLQNDNGHEPVSIQFEFAHDRFRQAFYTILPEQNRRRVHLALATYCEQAGAEGCGGVDRHFTIADHYLQAFSIIESAEEKLRVAHLLLQAARSASLLSAYDMALCYARQIIASLAYLYPVDDSFVFSVYTVYHLALCSLARYDEADDAYRLLQELAPSPLLLTDSCCLQAVALSNRIRYEDGFMLGVELLEKLGVPFPQGDLVQTVSAEITAYYADLERENFAGIASRSEAADQKEFAIQKILNRIAAAGLFFNPIYSSWTVITSARRILAHGYTPEGLQLYASLLPLLTPTRNDYKLAYKAANAARKIGEKAGYKNALYRTYHVFSLFTCHWFEDVKSALTYARESFEGNHAVGDFEYACFTYFTTQQAVLETCRQINELAAENEAALAYATKTGNRHASESYASYAQFYKALKGQTGAFGSFDDSVFQEKAHLAHTASDAMAQCYYYILRALCAAIYLDYDTAFALTERVIPLLPAIVGFYPVSIHNFLHSLAICKLLESNACGQAEKESLLATLSANQKWLGERAADAPMNFRHLFSAIEAERAALSGAHSELVVLYETAMEQAAVNERPYHYAMISELAAQRFIKLGAHKTAANFMREAYAAYLAWGADGKVGQLRLSYGSLLAVNQAARKAAVTHSASCTSDSLSLRDASDYSALIAASQAISGEIQLEAILDKLINILLENSGAQDIYYLTKNEQGGYIIRAEGHSLGGGKNIGKRAVDAGSIALGILHYVDRTGETLALDNAPYSELFMHDTHIVSAAPKSVLCMPIVNKGDRKGILYLENKLVQGIFGTKRLEALGVIASQLAISLENAYLYANLQFLVDDRTKELKEEIGIRRMAEARLERMANHDTLTNLPNRRMFQAHLERSINAASYAKSMVAVLFIDLDGFKLINDRYGHDKGDIVLIAVANRLIEAVRSFDMVCRLGGDEFILVIENVKSNAALARLCKRIINAIKEPIRIDDAGKTAVVTSSIGISLLGSDGNTAEELISNSDKAMYEAKKAGKNQYAFYEKGQ